MTVLANARIVRADGVRLGRLRIDGGHIAAFDADGGDSGSEPGPGAPHSRSGGPGPGPGAGGPGPGPGGPGSRFGGPESGGPGSGSGGPGSGSGGSGSGSGGPRPGSGGTGSGGHVDGGAAASEDIVDLGGRYVIPGFVDMHAHGAVGASFQSGRGEDVRRIVDFHRSHGTTTMMASTVTGSPRELIDAVAGLADSAAAGLIAGIHLEGPYISPGRCGAHDPKQLRDPDRAEFARLVEAGRGHVRMITLAPELPGALDLVRDAVASGVIAAVGHTDATAGRTRVALAAGARVATHLFNAMRPLHHREGGPITATLNDPLVTTELINDGIHVAGDVAKLVYAAAGADRVALITDAMAATGMGDGEYELGAMKVVVRDGRATLAEGSSIAGSTITMADAFRRAVLDVGLPIERAATSAALTPARALGIDHRVGSLDPGKDADLVVLDGDLTVARVMKGGAWG